MRPSNCRILYEIYNSKCTNIAAIDKYPTLIHKSYQLHRSLILDHIPGGEWGGGVDVSVKPAVTLGVIVSLLAFEFLN